MRIQSDLEVIERDGDHSDTFVVSFLLAFGLVVAKDDRLVLTRAGKQVLAQ